MAYTIEQYNALTAAIAQGVNTVKYADKELEYRSLEEMRSLKEEMEAELGILDPKRRKKVVFAGFSRGFNPPKCK